MLPRGGKFVNGNPPGGLTGGAARDKIWFNLEQMKDRRTFMDQKTTDLSQGSVGRLLLRLSLPTITSQIVNMLYNLVDRV